jgi:ubiquinone/menaquinone biosynthesis C-methylase UbiE
MSEPHSAEYFGEQRDFWWNRDFLDFMAKRWRLSEASSLADIGCGLCHWSRLLYPYLKQPARFAGVDRESRWAREAEQHFRRALPTAATESTVTFLQGDATAIPLPDNSFDVVTCQTVLMHLAHPMEALREMVRILRPGGLLVCVEPNNLWNYLAFTSLTDREPVETIVRRFEFWLRYHRGKMADGEGNHCIGDLLPGYFAQLRLNDIRVHLSDKAHSLFPPYDQPGQKALLQQEREWKSSGTAEWNRDHVRELVLAGGGAEEFFERVFSELDRKYDDEQKAIAGQTFHAGFGSLCYLVSGRKP